MDKLVPFINDHLVLVVLFVIAVFALFVVEARRRGAGTFRISAQALVRMINHHEAIVVDLRDATAYKKGHIQSALTMPWADFSRDHKKLVKHKERSIVFVCQGGQNSVKALTQLRKQGYHHLHVLAGGFVAWTNADLPLTNKS